MIAVTPEDGGAASGTDEGHSTDRPSPGSGGGAYIDNPRLLYGDDRPRTRHGDEFNGVRFNLAYWLDDAHSVAVEGNAFFLERDSTHFKAVSDGGALLARPCTKPDTRYLLSVRSVTSVADSLDRLKNGRDPLPRPDAHRRQA